MNLASLANILIDVMGAEDHRLPHDREACLECVYHSSNLKDGTGPSHCYMFRDEPETLCMQFRKINIVRV